MCKNTIVIKQSKNGRVTKCEKCNNFHLIFGQFYLIFNKTELIKFQKFIKNIDSDYWENTLNTFQLERRIPIPTKQNNLHLMLNKSEFDELSDLLNFSKTKKVLPILSSKDITYSAIHN